MGYKHPRHSKLGSSCCKLNFNIACNSTYNNQQKAEYLDSILTEIALLFAKITFFFMYLEIFNPMRWMRISSWAGVAVTSAFYLAVLIANLIFSTPRSGQSWAEAAFNEQGTLALSIPQAVIGLTIDLYILILPIIAVSKLHLPTQRKIGVIAIFMSGLLYAIASTSS